MLCSLIETYADIGGIAQPDLNLKVLLRHNVVPAFLHDVGFVSWRRQVAALPIAASTSGYDLPEDFWMMQSLALDSAPSSPLQYIGDDAEKVMAAEIATTSGTPAQPGGYYLVRRATTQVFKRLKLNVIPDATYPAHYTYYSGVPFVDDTTDVEMDKYIPNQFQWVFVEGLKKEIMFLRFGIGDPRYVAAEQSYGTWVARASENPELARRSHVAFAR
jgi:hypothetical protein